MPRTEGVPGGSRRRARELALRGLYRAEVVGDPVPEIAAELAADASVPEAVRDYAVHLMSLVGQAREEIDALLTGSLRDWTLERLAVTDRCVLRMATAELLFDPRLPVPVVLDEAIELARMYGTDHSGRFVNGVLDGVARKCRNRQDQEAPPE